MSSTVIIYLIVSTLVIIFLLGFIVYSIKFSGNKYAREISIPVVIGIVGILCYCSFLSCKNYTRAMIYNTLYFITTDWLALAMLSFALEYTGFKKITLPIFLAGASLCILDSIALIVNLFTKTAHMYVLDKIVVNGSDAWMLHLYWPHYIHLGICYIFVAGTLFELFISAIRAPYHYKKKYLWIFVMYLVLIIVNVIGYQVNKVIDYSVPLYGLLAGFIGHYSGKLFPQQIINDSLTTLAEEMDNGIVCFDLNGKIIYANKEIKKVFQEQGKFNEEEAEKFHKQWEQEIRLQQITNPEREPKKQDQQKFEINGQERIFGVEYEKLSSDITIGSYMSFKDRTDEYKDLFQEIYLTTHDHLTGLYNRETFFGKCDQIIKKNPEKQMLMLCSNIKDFKLINEFFGEETGDHVLVRQAGLLSKHASSESVCGRIGDDKFALFMEKSKFNKDIFLDSIAEMQQLTEGSQYIMRIVVGISETHGTETAQVLYDQAKIAMDCGDSDYKETFFYYDSTLMERLVAEKNFVSRFYQCMNDGSICMFLQPLTDGNGQIIGAEALVRWKQQFTGKIQTPGEFINILEKAYLIHRLDAYIWEEAAKTLSQWKKAGKEDLFISVNVSPKDIHYMDIYENFQELVNKYDISPSNLKIEFTERVLTEDFKAYMELFTKLQNAGFKIAIDNFGSDYSSLNLLKDIKADIVKIDMLHLLQNQDSERNKIILQFIVSTAQALNMQVFTEGVETEEQVKMINTVGSDGFQGNFYSEPLSIENFEETYLEK